jgi:hypothetical protein
MVKINNVSYHTTVIFFSFVCISAPISGAVISGIIGEKLGGFHSKNCIMFVTCASFVAIGLGIPIPLLETNWLVFLMIWLLFFAGGICVPMQTGIMLSLVEP